jgi:hypothetical protein
MTATNTRSSTVTVCSKLPFDFVAEFGGKNVTFAGGRTMDRTTGDLHLTGEFGITPDVDADWWKGWTTAAHDFMPLQTGAIFASTSAEPHAEARERKRSVKSGLEQKTPEELGVQVTASEEKG